MPKARNPNRDRAYEIWSAENGKIKLKDIAARLKEPESKIRKWKCVDEWEQKEKERSKKQKERSKRMGPPKGNKNALGHGAPKGNKNAYKHGAYSDPYVHNLTEREKALYLAITDDEEELIIEQIKFLTIREVRISEAIDRMKEKSGSTGMMIDRITRSEDKRSFKKGTNEEMLYEQIIADKVASGERLPGNKYHLETVTTPVNKTLLNLENELTRIQKQKAGYIALLMEHRERTGGETEEIEDTSDTDGEIYGTD